MGPEVNYRNVTEQNLMHMVAIGDGITLVSEVWTSVAHADLELAADGGRGHRSLQRRLVAIERQSGAASFPELRAGSGGAAALMPRSVIH